MFCHLLLRLVSGLVVVSPVTWPPVPQQPTRGLILWYAPRTQGLQTTLNLGHTSITLKGDQDAQHFQDYLMSCGKDDSVLNPLLWPYFA